MIPDEIETLLTTRFDYPTILLAQVATDGPDLRTMGMFDIDTQGRPILLTNTASNKWSQLIQNLRLALLLFNKERDVQIIVRGKAELLTEDKKVLEHYWTLTPLQAKVTYNHKDPEGEFQAFEEHLHQLIPSRQLWGHPCDTHPLGNTSHR